jgi:hypothetical protein
MFALIVMEDIYICNTRPLVRDIIGVRSGMWWDATPPQDEASDPRDIGSPSREDGSLARIETLERRDRGRPGKREAAVDVFHESSDKMETTPEATDGVVERQ